MSHSVTLVRPAAPPSVCDVIYDGPYLRQLQLQELAGTFCLEISCWQQQKIRAVIQISTQQELSKFLLKHFPRNFSIYFCRRKNLTP